MTKMKRVMVFGTFDLLHKGHIDFFKQAKKQGEVLYAVIARDNNVRKFKGKAPTNNERVRLSRVNKLDIADAVILGDKEDIFETIREIKPEVICLGYDQNSRSAEQAFPEIKFVRLEAFNPQIHKSSKHQRILDTVREYVLEYPFIPNKEFPFILHHPLSNSTATMDVNHQLIQLDKDNLKDFCLDRLKYIEDKVLTKNDGLFGLFLMINKPFRIPLFLRIMDFLDEAQYNDLVQDLWTDTEFPHENTMDDLEKFFSRVDRNIIMGAPEKKAFAKMPDELTIYRGLQQGAVVYGFSWTTDIKIAKWFAKRFNHNGQVYQAKVDKSDIFFYFNGRKEKEVVVHPSKLYEVKKSCPTPEKR